MLSEYNMVSMCLNGIFSSVASQNVDDVSVGQYVRTTYMYCILHCGGKNGIALFLILPS